MDLAVNALTLLGQIFVAGRVMTRYGLGGALAFLPLAAAWMVLGLRLGARREALRQSAPPRQP